MTLPLDDICDLDCVTSLSPAVIAMSAALNAA
mgnify:CR=1 FL=1